MPLLPSGDEAGFAAEQLIERSKMLRIALTGWMAACDALVLNAYEFLGDFHFRRLKGARAVWPERAAVPGVPALIRQRVPGFADDAAVTAQLGTIQTAMDVLINYIETNVQASLVVAGGWIAILSVVNDQFVPRTITSGAALAALKAQLQLLRNELSA